MVSERATFFSTDDEDAALEGINLVFWHSLFDHIEADHGGRPQIGTIIDIGSHRGGFLHRAVERWKCQHAFGIEPLEAAREMAVSRLEAAGISATFLPPVRWNVIPANTADLIVGQEMLYLVSDLPELMQNVARVLRPRRKAYFTLGCHTENPLWPEWRAILQAGGTITYDYGPLEIMRHAESVGMRTAVRPLRRDGWIHHHPLTARYPVPSVSALCDHHYQHKLLFRFEI